MAKPNASAYSYQTDDFYLHLIIIKIVVLRKYLILESLVHK